MLGINAAFLQEIKDVSQELFQLQGAINDLWDSSDRVWIDASRLAILLGDLRDQLEWHFTLEERLGYLDDAVNVAPRLSRQAEQLRVEHGSLYHELAWITDEMEGRAHGNENLPRTALLDLRTDFNRFWRKFELHEEREDDLIIESLYFDIGGSE
jgi:hypothetical protein